MNDIAIRVENLGKLYRIGTGPRHDTLRDALAGFGRKNPQSAIHNPKSEEFWALRDVSFEVKRGEVVGVIGRNGAGKSTLLKILSRITEPTTGTAEIHGRVGSLLEVGTGFHPELTGRENIYLNGAILGMKRTEIDRKFDEIVAFSEIEKFLDTPVKRYSSGMYVRLAFAVAAHLEPEILLVDEVLAVGDAAFQKKCLGKMGDIAGEGRTVLFVSHQMSSIVNLCSRSLVLDSGIVCFEGSAVEGVQAYMSQGSSQSGVCVLKEASSPPGEGGIGFEFIRLVNSNGLTISEVTNVEDCFVEIGYQILSTIGNLFVGLQLVTSDGIVVFDTHDQDSQDMFPKGRERGRYVGRCRIPRLLLNSGTYSLNLVSYVPGYKLLVFKENVLSFQVIYVGGIGPNAKKPGVVRLPFEWSVSRM